MKELLLVQGTVGLLEPIDENPRFKYVVDPCWRPAISRTHEINWIFYRIPGGRSFEEANATDRTLFISEPTFVAEDFMDQLLKGETDETKGRMPPIRVVALKVYEENCFKDEPKEINHRISEEMVVYLLRRMRLHLK